MMLCNLLELTLEEIQQGYCFDAQKKKYSCNICGKEYFIGEIYPIGEKFFTSKRAIELHFTQKHPDMFEILTQSESKYLNITDNQKKLLSLIGCGLSDNEIAKEMEVSPSTIRHQKFMFREKAKQAKLYLAIYTLTTTKAAMDRDLVKAHDTATMVDDRYITTYTECEKILTTSFSSFTPLKLKNFPAKEKKKLVVLRKIAEQFIQGRQYNEKEINTVLKDIFEDFVTIRRYLIEYGFMERTTDCRTYWLK